MISWVAALPASRAWRLLHEHNFMPKYCYTAEICAGAPSHFFTNVLLCSDNHQLGCCWEITLSPSHPTSPCADGISLKQGTAKKPTHAHVLRGLPPTTLVQGFLLLHTALPLSKEPHSLANTLSSAGGTEVSVWHEERRENGQLAYLRAWHSGTHVYRVVQEGWVL